MPSLSPRDLPSVDRLLRDAALQHLLEEQSPAVVTNAARDILDEARRGLLNGGFSHGLDDLPGLVVERVRQHTRLELQPVINATGVVIHTNLGRAPLSSAALNAAHDAAAGYSNLEYDLASGERGSRHGLVAGLLRRLTGAEDALVVNNNAAAILLVLSALASGREAIISRGQLVEIGGGFRIPDVMRQSGAALVEVGTTNRTYVADYAAAITDRTAVLLRVHASNFRILGFTSFPGLEDLTQLAHDKGLVMADDLGSGALLDTSEYGLAREPMVQDSVRAGCSVVAFSGDKLLGGPQAGILVGQAEIIAALRKHPLTRAIRPDKLTLACLGATLLHYVRGEAEREIPVWRMISASVASLDQRAQAVITRFGLQAGQVEATQSTIGGGSLPGETLESRAIALNGPSLDALAASLRRASPPVVGRIERERLLLDLRTVLPEQDSLLGAALGAALA